VDRPANEWIGISGRFIHRFQSICACCGSPERPSRFSFRNRFRFHAMRILLTRVFVCVCILSYYYTHCIVKKIKRENRPLIASAHTRYIAHKYFVSKPSSAYIYYLRLAYIIVRKCVTPTVVSRR